MLSDEEYENCLSTLEEEAVDSEARAERLEQLFQRAPFFLKGQELEDAVLEALWLWQGYSTNHRLPQRPIRRLPGRYRGGSPPTTPATTFKPCAQQWSTPDYRLGRNESLARPLWLGCSTPQYHSHSLSPPALDACPSPTSPSAASAISSTSQDPCPSIIHNRTIEAEDFRVAIMDTSEAIMYESPSLGSPWSDREHDCTFGYDSPTAVVAKRQCEPSIFLPPTHHSQRLSQKRMSNPNIWTVPNLASSASLLNSGFDPCSNILVRNPPGPSRPQPCITVAFNLFQRFAAVPTLEHRPRTILTKAEARKRALRRELKTWEMG